MQSKIKNTARLIRPCDIPAAKELAAFITKMDQKYGVNSNGGTSNKNTFGCLDMKEPLVSHMYESNIYYFLFGNSSDIKHLPEYGYPAFPFNTVMKAALSGGVVQPERKKIPLQMEEVDKDRLFNLREKAYTALRAAYPKKPQFENGETTPEECDKALQEQGFANGTHKIKESFKIGAKVDDIFEVSYSRLSTNKSPYFSTSYRYFQNQEELPHKSLAYRFYKKWNVFHCVEMTLDEFDEMRTDLEELKAQYKK